MSLRLAAILTALIPLTATPAVAQRLSSPLSFTVFGGAAIPVGDSSDDLQTGYTVGAAVDLRVPTTSLGGRLEGSYSSFDAKGPASAVTSGGSDLGANLNLVFWIPKSIPSPITPYLTAGPSFSRLEASTSLGSTSISVTENHWGFNVGGGVDVGLSGFAVRFDARYKRISTDDGSFQMVPVTVGIRF